MGDISTMPAGPEMDRMVAEKVMGWHADCRKPGDWPFIECRVKEAGDPDPFEMWRPWSPSSNIAHAWEVVERMGVAGFKAQVGRHEDGEGWCEFTDHRDLFLNRYGAGQCDTVPLAICRAALLAVGVAAGEGNP